MIDDPGEIATETTITGLETTKDRLEGIFARAPVIRDANDPIMAGFLWLLAGAAVALIVTAHDIFPTDHEAVGHIVQIVGGIVLLTGAYFTANRLAVQRTQQRAEMLSKLFDQLDTTKPATCVGAIRLIQAVACDLPKNRAAAKDTETVELAIGDVLNVLRSDGDHDPRIERAINKVLKSLPALESSTDPTCD